MSEGLGFRGVLGSRVQVLRGPGLGLGIWKSRKMQFLSGIFKLNYLERIYRAKTAYLKVT